MRQFAQDEVVIPEGEHIGKRWRAYRQPAQGLFLDAIDSGQWNRFAVTGCVQSGKSLIGFVIPAMYYLFELAEPVILGVPTLDIAQSKWTKELRPAILASRYAEFMPRKGAGSRRGFTEMVEFSNGAILKFMSSHGGDEKRSSFTSRILIATEIDKMDVVGGVSREASPIRQLEARTEAHDFWDRRVFLECTASVEEGAIWKEYEAGTHSRIVCQCPYCSQWITPEREHISGWEDADNELDVLEESCFKCLKCDHQLTDMDRKDMNKGAKVLHEKQTISKEGEISGDLKKTATFSFRYNAFNNMFWSSGKIGRDAWNARLAEDEDDVEKYQCQFIWATPYKPTWQEKMKVSPAKLTQRQRQWTRGLIPDGMTHLGLGIDLGSKWCHWVLMAGMADKTGHIVEYGTIQVDAKDRQVEDGIIQALTEFKEKRIDVGWLDSSGKSVKPDLVCIDSGGGWSKSVFGFVRDSGQSVYIPTKGYGIGQRSRRYNPVLRSGNIRHSPSLYYHSVRIMSDRVSVLEFDANYWKSRLQKFLIIEIDNKVPPGAITLFVANKNDHQTFARHISAEEYREETDPKRGKVIVWENPHKRQNHYFDSAILAMIARHKAGFRVSEDSKRKSIRKTKNAVMPDGRPYLVTER